MNTPLVRPADDNEPYGDPAPSDTDRLDWLESNLSYLMLGANYETGRMAMEALNSRGHGWKNGELRRALDAAMTSGHGPTCSNRFSPIPPLTGCCIACGDRLDITQGPVNDVTCVRVRPHCACNQGVHLWQSAHAAPAEPCR